MVRAVKVRREGRFIVGGVMRSGSQVTGLLVGQRERGGDRLRDPALRELHVIR